MPSYLFALLAGYILELCFGELRYTYDWTSLIKGWILHLEAQISNKFPKTGKGKTFMNLVFIGFVMIILGEGGAIALLLADFLHPMASFFVASIICYQMLHTKSLLDKSRKVYRELKAGNLHNAKKAVSALTEEKVSLHNQEEVAKVTVELVAEHTLDHVIGPLFYMALLGPVGGIVYGAANMMGDLFFEREYVTLKEAVNYIPSHLFVGFVIISCAFLKMPVKEAYRIYRRDGDALGNLNLGRIEAVCAGALGVQLLGDTGHKEELHRSTFVGDAKRKIQAGDILSMNRILSISSYLGLVLFILGCWGIWNLKR